MKCTFYSIIFTPTWWLDLYINIIEGIDVNTVDCNVCLKIHHLLSQSLYALVATRLPYSSSILTLFQRQIGIECECFHSSSLFLGRFALDQRRFSNTTICLVQHWKFPASGIKILHNLRDYIVWCNFSALDDLQQREK